MQKEERKVLFCFLGLLGNEWLSGGSRSMTHDDDRSPGLRCPKCAGHDCGCGPTATNAAAMKYRMQENDDDYPPVRVKVV